MNEWLFWALAAALTGIIALGLTAPLRAEADRGGQAAGPKGGRYRIWAIVLLVPLASVALYVFLGRPDLLNH